MLAPLPPVATTQPASAITENQATLNGIVNPNGAAANAWFEWGETTAYGNNTAAQPLGNGPFNLSFSDTITGLATDQA